MPRYVLASRSDWLQLITARLGQTYSLSGDVENSWNTHHLSLWKLLFILWLKNTLLTTACWSTGIIIIRQLPSSQTAEASCVAVESGYFVPSQITRLTLRKSIFMFLNWLWIIDDNTQDSWPSVMLYITKRKFWWLVFNHLPYRKPNPTVRQHKTAGISGPV